MFGQRLLLLIALLATLVVLGSWDNRREIERVLAEGYDATGRITGAQNQRGMPLVIDGWRPRLAEQALSVDISWPGRDGKERAHKNVPVSESFARTIVTGDQVHLVPVALKALDDEQSVPVIVNDAAQRLGSLGSWSTTSGAIALAAWLGFAVLTLWRRRQGQGRASRQGRGAAHAPTLALWALPPRRTIAGVLLVLAGGAVAYWAWSAREAAETAKTAGTSITAEIVSVGSASGGGHSVVLSWKDAAGAVHHFGPVPISARFYGEITREGRLTVHQTEVRVREDSPQVRPVIVADVRDPGWGAEAGVAAGLLLLAIGLGCLFSALRIVASNSH